MLKSKRLLAFVLCAVSVLVSARVAESTPAQVGQQRVTLVSTAYDGLYRETRNAVGYAQIFRGGGDTADFERWQAAKARAPAGMASLISRCEPPVLEARALLVESYAIMQRRGPPSDVELINQQGAQATRLLDSVADCWQAMVRYERNCPHALSTPPHDRRARARRLVADDVFRLDASETHCIGTPRPRATYPSPAYIPQNPVPAPVSKPSRPKHPLQGHTVISGTPPKKPLGPITEDPSWGAWHKKIFDRLTRGLQQSEFYRNGSCRFAKTAVYTIRQEDPALPYSTLVNTSVTSTPPLFDCENAIREALLGKLPKFPDGRCATVTLEIDLQHSTNFNAGWTATCR